MDEKPKSKFEELAAIDVGKKIEKKNGLSYLSWAWALDTLMRADPEAHWEYGEPKMFGETMMVYCSVLAFAKWRTAHLPVMDYKNKCIPNPDAFAVNTAMQRVFVKAIAMHGLGLYIYAGEDLPLADDDGNAAAKAAPKADLNVTPTAGTWEALSEDERVWLSDVANEVRALLKKNDVTGALLRIKDEKLDADKEVALVTRFDSKERTAMKKEQERQRLERVKKAQESDLAMQA